MPARAVAASSACHSGPSVTGAGRRPLRSTAITASGVTRSENDLSSVVSRSIFVIVSNPVDVPENERLKISATTSGVKAPRMVASISEPVMPRPSQAPTMAPMLLPAT